MNLLPFKNIELTSLLNKIEIEDAIRDTIAWTEHLGMVFSQNTTREYEGFIGDGTFKFRRILKNGTNSFIPIVSGTISENENGTSRITLKLRLHIFATIMTIIVLLFSLGTFINAVCNRGVEILDFKSLLFIVPYLLCLFFMNREAQIVTRKIETLLKAKQL